MIHNGCKYWLGVLLLSALAMLVSSATTIAAPKRAIVTASGADADFIALREASLRGEIAEAGRLAVPPEGDGDDGDE